MAEIKNCERCGEIFASVAGREICHHCYQQEEKDFKTVYQFLTKQRNRQATINEIVEKTDVEEDLIIKFIKKNRLRTSQFPNLAYPCEKCGNPITEGKLCESCTTDIKTQLERHEKMEQRKQNEREKADTVYYSVNKKK